MNRRILLVADERIYDHGHPLWPAREPPSNQERNVWAALDILTPRQREIVEMRIWADWTFKQIGAKLGISKQAAHSTYDRAITRLEEELT
jgi:RNA polymerase sigma factor (sigma-70 family)